MLDLCYLWYSCDVAWDICVIMWYLWWMWLIYTILLVWNVYMLSLWWWMWLLHKKQKKYKKKQALPSVFSLTLGKATIFLFSGRRICQVQLHRHSAKFGALASARRVALGKDSNFAECFPEGTRQRPPFPPRFARHVLPVPCRSPVRLPGLLSRSYFFAECDLAHGNTLPSAREMALGKACFAVSLNAVCSSPWATLGKVVAEYFLGFPECFGHSAK